MGEKETFLFDVETLREWFKVNKRVLPWRKNPTPYKVFISELMLQQTQACVVIPYFEKWMKRFPSLIDIAKAPFEEVIKFWEGLGYYARVRTIYAAAKTWGNEIPSSPEKLMEMKGLGVYLVGAIRSFGFKQRAVAVDGNVMRVITRLFCIEEDVSSSKTIKRLRLYAEHMLPEEKPWEIAEAFIELGALICKKNPDCLNCPLSKKCLAFQKGKAGILPIKKARPETTILHRLVAIIYVDHFILLRKNENGIMRDLWELPYFEAGENNSLHSSKKIIEDALGIKLKHLAMLRVFSHGFTRYKAYLYPRIWETGQRNEIKGFQWIEKKKLKKLSFSSGHRKILAAYFSSYG